MIDFGDKRGAGVVQNFSELCRMYHDQVTRNHNYGLQAGQFMRGFAAELAKQIGAPEMFTMHEENKKVRYVRPLTLNPETGSLEPAGIFLQWDDQHGVWDAGVGIHLEPAKNAFPKTEFATRLRFRLSEGNIDLEIPPNGQFQMKVDDRSSWQPAIEHIITQLARTLNLQPWERYEEPPAEPDGESPEQREIIGFLRFDQES
ncbi:MAG: hypothetical protein ABSD08_16710 [Xanthobacteraceae bacterium]|jgi:hypothetical protein